MVMSNCIYIMLVWTHLTRRERVELMLYYLIRKIDKEFYSVLHSYRLLVCYFKTIV